VSVNVATDPWGVKSRPQNPDRPGPDRVVVDTLRAPWYLENVDSYHHDRNKTTCHHGN